MSDLRDALNWLVHLHHGVSKGGDYIDPETGDRLPVSVTAEEWEAALEKAKQALEAPSEMQQLRTRIEQIRDGCLEETAPPGPLDSWDKGYLSALRSVLDEIAEFLGEER